MFSSVGASWLCSGIGTALSARERQSGNSDLDRSSSVAGADSVTRNAPGYRQPSRPVSHGIDDRTHSMPESSPPRVPQISIAESSLQRQSLPQLPLSQHQQPPKPKSSSISATQVAGQRRPLSPSKCARADCGGEEQLSVIGHQWCRLSILHDSPADRAPDSRALIGFGP